MTAPKKLPYCTSCKYIKTPEDRKSYNEYHRNYYRKKRVEQIEKQEDSDIILRAMANNLKRRGWYVLDSKEQLVEKNTRLEIKNRLDYYKKLSRIYKCISYLLLASLILYLFI